MTQLVQPNLSVTGQIGWCLKYAANVFGIQFAKPSAWQEWQNCKYPHTDRNLPNNSVPLWFSFWTTIDGVYANWGHVVVQVPGQGFYSSPWRQGTTHAVLGSIAEVERIYGVKYVGWSEDIANVKVVGEDMLNYDQVDSMAHAYLDDSIANNPGLKQYVGKPAGEVIAAFNGAKQRAAFLKEIEDLRKGQQFEVVGQYKSNPLYGKKG